MKRLMILAFFCLTAIALTGCSQKKAEQKEIMMYGYSGSEEKELLVENEYLELHFIPESTKFYVVDKMSKNIWYSNPENAKQDTKADGTNKQLLQSQLSLTYANSAGSTTTLNNFAYSIEKGLYDFTQTEKGFEVNYTIGNIDRVYYIPVAVPESRMLEFYDQLDKSGQRKVGQYYKKYDINKLSSSDNKSDLLDKYPELASEPIYELRDTTKPYLKVQLEEMFGAVGYTQQDYEEDIARYNTTSSEEKPVYNVTIRYELDKDSLLVTIPYDKIAYKLDYPITQLRVLPFFGAGSVEDEGYLFVPDGSGALINFNNGKNNQISYTNSMYGWDYGLSREAVINDNKALYPVFGIQKNGAAMMCIIEQGSAYANIEADVSGRGNSYNNVLAQYAMIHGETMDISSKSDTTVILYENELPKESIVQRFKFCKESGYMGMAKEYRTYLMDKYPQLVKQTDTEIPVAVEFVGAVNKTQHVLGFPVDKPLALTTYSQARTMVEELTELGFKNVHYKLNGWFNDSILHSVPSNIKLIGKLGNQKSLKNLVAAVADTGSNLCLEADFLYMRDNSLFDSFSLTKDAARYINRERVESYPYSFVWYGERDRWGKLSYLARPAYMRELIEGYTKEIKDYGSCGISFRTIGTNLAGDYNEKRLVSREASMNMQVEELAKLKEENESIMIYSGYSYAMPYADFIVDMPLTGQGFAIVDEEIPFYQIVLHGLVDFSGRPVNLAEEYTNNLLKTAECGAGLGFSFIHESTAVLQDTKYHKYYANEYSMWKDTANEVYQKYQSDLGATFNQFITDHQILTKNVTMTQYEDGTQVIVNYTGYPYTYGKTTVEPRSYSVIRGEN